MAEKIRHGAVERVPHLLDMKAAADTLPKSWRDDYVSLCLRFASLLELRATSS